MIERLGWTLIHSLWQGAGIAILLSLALLPTQRSITRYTFGCAALALMALLPVATFLVLDPNPSPPTGLGIGISPEVSNPILGWMVWAWVAGVALLSLRLVGSIAQLSRWKHRCTQPAEPTWQKRVDSLAARLGVAKAVALRVSDKVVVPCAWGILKPVLVLPACLVTHLSQDQIEALLLHELAHVRRHDYLFNLLQTALETVLFYHPATWWVSRIVRQERESCCDDLVVDALGDPMPYAYALLRLEEARYMLPQPALSATGGSLKIRVTRLLAGQPQPRSVFPFGSLLVAACVLGALLFTSVQAQSASQPSAPNRVAPLAKTMTPIRTLKHQEPVRAKTKRLAPRKPIEQPNPEKTKKPGRLNSPTRKAERQTPAATTKIPETPMSSTPQESPSRAGFQPDHPDNESGFVDAPVTQKKEPATVAEALFGDKGSQTKSDPKELGKLFFGDGTAPHNPAGYREALFKLYNG